MSGVGMVCGMCCACIVDYRARCGPDWMELETLNGIISGFLPEVFLAWISAILWYRYRQPVYILYIKYGCSLV